MARSRALVVAGARRYASVAHAENVKLIQDVSGALAQRLQGTAIETQRAGKSFRARLESVHLRRGGRDGAQFILTEVEWDGLGSETVVGEAREMTIGVLPKAVLTLFDVDCRRASKWLSSWRGRSPLAALAT